MFEIQVISTQVAALAVAAALINRSAWFELTPLPDDEWEFKYKAGEGLNQVVQAAVWAVTETLNP